MCKGTSEQNADFVIMKLRELHSTIYVPLVTRNVPFYKVNDKVRSEVFSLKVEQFFGV